MKPSGFYEILIPESDPLPRESSQHPVLSQQALRLSNILQTTLDVYELIKQFYQEIQQFVPFHSFHYHHAQTDHGIGFGLQATHHHQYPLELQGTSLGEILITRQTAFSEQELLTIENALVYLLYPLRNAILYHRAIVNSFTCPLTKIANRAAFDKTIAREIDFAKRHQTIFSLLMCDVDHFKKINDQYGHHAGDHVLSSLANVLSENNRNTDPVFRYGGEEFMLVLNHTPIQGAIFVAERLRQQVENCHFCYQQVTIPTTISIGITTYQNNDNPERLFKRVDKALYQAKKLGRNRIFSIE